MIKTKKTVYVSLFAALIAAGAIITIPIGPVPISLQTLFVMLAGVLMGAKAGTLSVFIYLLAGAAGLPVFSGGAGGIGHFLGPTGGYLIGFLAAAFIAGNISSFKVKKAKYKIFIDALSMTVAAVAIYTFGVIWLKIALKINFYKALSIGMIPFLPGDILKITAGAYIAKKLRPAFNVFD